MVPRNSSNKISTLLNYVEQEYVDTVSMDSLIERSIPNILENLDPHSVYIPAKDLEKVSEPLEGNFDGIGVQFNIQKDTVFVVKVVPNGPSARVGIKDGDRIVTVNDSLIAGVKITNPKVMKLLRGSKGSKVRVGIMRPGEAKLLQFNIIRDKIPIYSVDVSYMMDQETGYIKINKFSRTTWEEFVQSAEKLKVQGMKKLILDLRSNGGGFLDAAVNLADEFLPDGKLVVYTQGKARPKSSFYSTSKGTCENIGLIVLMDEWSASASEIVAGAIQDNDRGLVIGRRSFGKGLVQEPILFADGSSLRLTIARYYTPSGRCIQKPYSNGTDEYNNDIGERIYKGEFLKADSSWFNDSLKYFTSSGRAVYGGGGIMPDVFVPFDTLGTSDYYYKINRKGLEYQFAFEYTDQNRRQLETFTDIKLLKAYLDKQNMLQQFIKFASKKGIDENKKDISVSGFIIETQVKALIARNILDNDGFFPIIQDVDATLLKAYDLIRKDGNLLENVKKLNP